MRVARLLGDTVRTADAKGPRCDRNSAFCASVKVHYCQELLLQTTRDVATQIGVLLAPPADPWLVVCVGEDPLRGHDQPCFTEGVGAIPHCLETRGHFMVDSNQHDFCHFWVPLLDHANAIGPTGPMGCHCGPCSAAEPQTTSRQRQIGQHPGQVWCPRACKHIHTLRSWRSAKF